MRFEVKKGTVKRKGVFHRKGSFFDAEKDDVKALIASGIIVPVEAEPLDSNGGTGEGQLMSSHQIDADMTIEEIKKFLESAGQDEVESMLQAELGKPKPRQTAVKLLNDWLERVGSDADPELPDFNSDDVIVDGESE